MQNNEKYNTYLKSSTWNKKRQETFALKGRFCQRCKITKKLHVHHATYEHLFEEDVLNELYVLCDDCHSEYHRRTSKISIRSTRSFIEGRIFRTKETKKQRKLNKSLRKLYGLKFNIRNKKYKISKVRLHHSSPL